MTRIPRGFHRQADDTLVCPHRDLSVCPACEQAHPEITESLGQHYWITDPLERETIRADCAAIEAKWEQERAAQAHPDAIAGVVRIIGQWAEFVPPSLTCSEAEALADLARFHGSDDLADRFLARHADQDEPGDIHYTEELTP